MVEPLATLTAGAIAQLAFNEFIKSSAGELAKKTLSGAIDSAKVLREKIQARFRGNQRAEVALAEVQEQGTITALNKVTKYLDIEMLEDEEFATEIRKLAPGSNSVCVRLFGERPPAIEGSRNEQIA
jgi:hypothetical protein